jgi:hypothetical protein
MLPASQGFQVRETFTFFKRIEKLLISEMKERVEPLDTEIIIKNAIKILHSPV